MHATHRTHRALESPGYDEVRRRMAAAQRLRAEAQTEAMRSLGRAVVRTSRNLHRAARARVRSWASGRSLALLSDRSLADIGIPRHAIRSAVRGIDWRTADPGQSVWRRRFRPVMGRFAAWREDRARRERFRRELEAYSDRDLDELGIFRADIPKLARAA